MSLTGLKRVLAGLVAATLLTAGASRAAITPLGVNSGWEVEFSDSLLGLVQIITDDQTATTLRIEKFAQFTQLNPDGTVVPIDIIFRQTAASTITSIIIDDEVLTNQSGVTWTGFHFEISPGGGAAFNPAASATFSINPFTTSAFSNGNLAFDVGGGSVPDNTVWSPGAASGELVISVTSNPEPPFAQWTLREQPVIPEPTSLALAGIGALALLARRGRTSQRA